MEGTRPASEGTSEERSVKQQGVLQSLFVRELYVSEAFGMTGELVYEDCDPWARHYPESIDSS